MGCSSSKTAVSTPAPGTSDHVQKTSDQAQKKSDTVQKKPDTVRKKPETAQKKPDNVENKMSEEKHIPVQKTFKNNKLAALNYASVDEHARKAPPALRNSVHELVAYLTKPSKEPIMIVRAIFVWITENVAYDTDGFFGRSKYASCDAEDVINSGKSVCSGYANVMETLCREAGVPVKKIHGYAKGYGYSADIPFSTNMDTNHAWNAVQLNGKWYLIDSTWGAGHLGTNNTYEKCFKEFYFLTKPEEFLYSHFPYMDNDMDASMKWQLLEKPITLEQFSKLMLVQPIAFTLGVRPVSHKEGWIQMKNELTMSFQCVGQDELLYMTKLQYQQGSLMHEEPMSTFDQIENDLFTTRIHPHTTGTFHLKIYGRKSNENGSYHQMLKYVIQCEKVDNKNFRFPITYQQVQIDRCLLIEPLQRQLRHNSAVTFHIISPYLNRVMINHTYLEKTGMSFKGTVKTGSKGEELSVFGSRGDDFKSLRGLYNFEVV